MLVFSAWMVNHYSMAEREATEQQARWYARDLSKSIEHELRRVADQLNTLSQSRSLLGGDLENLYRRAAHAASIFKGTMVVRDGAGQQLINTRVPWGTALPVSALPQEARDDLAAGRTHISDLYIGAVKQQPVVTVTIPIMEQWQPHALDQPVARSGDPPDRPWDSPAAPWLDRAHRRPSGHHHCLDPKSGGVRSGNPPIRFPRRP